jgi:hypothetical protein
MRLIGGGGACGLWGYKIGLVLNLGCGSALLVVLLGCHDDTRLMMR